MSPHESPLIVVGAGPAGIGAAVEARRSGADVVLVDSSGVAGGTIRIAHEVRNVPFLPDRSPGTLVADGLCAFAHRWQLDAIAHECLSVERDGDGVVVVARDGARINGCGVVLATGARPLVPIVAGLPGVLEPPWACSAPDACRAGSIASAAIVGASDVAFDQARWLRARGVVVTVLCRAAVPRAPAWLVADACAEGVALRTATSVACGSVARSRWVLRLDSGGAGDELEVDRIVAAAGRAPAWRGSIAIEPQAMNRVRVAGDAVGRRARHVVAALGDGCTAAAELLAARERES